jgi:DtxR family Mn-dependent transcriptional regulator
MTDSIKYPLPTAEREDLEESLGLIWHKRESGDTSVPSLREALSAAGNAAAWDRLRNEGFVAEIDGRARLTDKGESTAAAVIRRHRLAERLLTDVLNLDRAVIDPNACVLEHILSAEVSESICTLLGHPAECPHGLAIPAGDCCRRNADQLSPIVEPLSRLKAGQSGRVAYLQLKDHPEAPPPDGPGTRAPGRTSSCIRPTPPSCWTWGKRNWPWKRPWPKDFRPARVKNS